MHGGSGLAWGDGFLPLYITIRDRSSKRKLEHTLFFRLIYYIPRTTVVLEVRLRHGTVKR